MLLSLVLLSVSACGARWPQWAIIESDPFGFLSTEDKNLTPPPPESSMVAVVSDPLVEAKPIALKSGGALGSFGLNLDTYFARDLKDMNERVDRLERVLSAMNKDMKILAPAVQDLTSDSRRAPMPLSYESGVDAQGQPVSLNALAPSQAGGSPLPHAPSAGAQAHVQKGAQPTAHASGQSAVVTGIRVGQHPDKVRLVFDVTKKTSFEVDLDNDENILVVELPNALWKTQVRHESFGRLPVVKSYKVNAFNQGQGNIFVLQLKAPTSILMKTKLPALSGNGERIVIDLKK